MTDHAQPERRLDLAQEIVRVRENLHAVNNRVQELTIEQTEAAGDIKLVQSQITGLVKNVEHMDGKMDLYSNDTRDLMRRMALIEKIVLTVCGAILMAVVMALLSGAVILPLPRALDQLGR